MDRLAYLDGARRPNPHRIQSYKVKFADGSSKMERFSEAQAMAYGTTLQPDGVPFAAAIRMVEKWNQQAARQGNVLEYSIPFVKTHLVRP